jgi:hypothetical protein
MMKAGNTQVTIPPNGVVVVYLSVYSSGSGAVYLAARTDALN